MSSKPPMDMTVSEISTFYSGKSVFITGSTGFLGKVLVEKLLRSCPGIGKIYLLLRPKRGKEVQERLDILLSDIIYEEVRNRNGGKDILKVVPMIGDCVKPGLGLSPEDRRKLINEVSIIFHSAATVRFDQPIKYSVSVNLTSTQEILQLCKEMPLIKALVYVSTAFCHSGVDIVEEKVYPAFTDPVKLIRVLNDMDDKMADSITDRLLDKHPNTYVFSKSLSESLLGEHHGKIPVVIVRPSIVVSSWREPIASWLDKEQAIAQMTIFVTKGLLRTCRITLSNAADFLPVDIGINTLITSAWYISEKSSDKLMVVNNTSSLNPVTWGDFIYWVTKCARNNPFSIFVWYPDVYTTGSLALFRTTDFFLHYIPAHIMDIILRFQGRKPRMVEIYHKLSSAGDAVMYFINREWAFAANNMLVMWNAMSPQSQNMFNFDIRQLDWVDFCNHTICGGARYVLKQDFRTIPAARKKLFRYYLLHRFVQFVALGILLMMMVNLYDYCVSAWTTTTSIIKPILCDNICKENINRSAYMQQHCSKM